MARSRAWCRARRRPDGCPQEGHAQRSQPPRASKAAPRVERAVAPPRRSQGQPCLGRKLGAAAPLDRRAQRRGSGRARPPGQSRRREEVVRH
eukprot:4834165-Alexandrium_andersonii.AAC.1